MDLSECTARSFVAFNGLPSKPSISTVIVPSYSVRVSRRESCSQVNNLPCLKVAPVSEPYGTFSPPRTGVKQLNPGIGNLVFGESWINDLDGGVGICHRLLLT